MRSRATDVSPPLSSLDEIEAKQTGPIALSELKHEPGFIEMMERSMKDPALVSLISFEDVIYFTTQTKLTRLVEDMMPAFAFNTPQIINKIRDWLRGYKILRKYEIEKYLPIAEVHCPKIGGCEAYFIQETTNQTDFYLGVKILGFGGGSGKSRSFGIGYEIPAKAGCRYVLVPVKFKIEECQTRSKENFLRGNVTTIGDGFKVMPISKDEDRCEKKTEEVKILGWPTHPYLLSQVPEQSTTSRSVKQGEKTEWDWEIEFPPIKLGVKGTVEVIKQFKYKYILTGKHDYSGYIPSDTFAYCWSWR